MKREVDGRAEEMEAAERDAGLRLACFKYCESSKSQRVKEDQPQPHTAAWPHAPDKGAYSVTRPRTKDASRRPLRSRQRALDVEAKKELDFRGVVYNKA